METMNEYMGLEVVSAAQNIAFLPWRTLQGKIAIRVLRQRSEVEVLNIGCNMLFPWRICRFGYERLVRIFFFIGIVE